MYVIERNPLMHYAIGIDIGGTSIKGIVLSQKGAGSFSSSVPTEGEKGGKKVLENILSLIDALLEKHGSSKNILGVGIGTPGAINEKGRIIGGAHNIPDWEGMQIFKPIGKKFGLATIAANDATAMTLAEWRYGAAKGFDNAVCLTLGTGIGGGIVANGELYHGTHGLGAELGHVSIDFDGIPCKCGQRGCVERYASATAIVETATALCKKNQTLKQTPFSKFVLNESKNLTAKIVYDYVDKKDALAVQVNEQVCDKLARIIGIVLNTLAPKRIVLGGGVMNAGKTIVATTWKNVPRYALAAQCKNCSLVAAKLGERAGVIGAAQLMFEKTLRT